MESQALKLDQLDETYEVIGEIAGGSPATRGFMAKRRADGADVLITVAQTPPGDEGNALSHLAADATLLSGQGHRNLVPVLEGRWLEAEAVAIVTERVNVPNLEELLERRDEEFDYPRIAMLLQEVNGVLEWARAQKVVHRAVDVSSVFVEPGSDRVLVSFVVRPLPLADMPGAEEDARTVATLARDMLTRSVANPERDNQPLAELRPGLPANVVAQTEALLAPASAGLRKPDVRAYLATIAMAESLKRGEDECATMVQVERAGLAKEKQAIELELERERGALAIERQALVNEREALAGERKALVSEREALAKERHAPVVVPTAQRRAARRVRLSYAAAALVLLIAVTLLSVGRSERLMPDRRPADGSAPRVVESTAGGITVDPMISAISALDVPEDLVAGVTARAAVAPPVVLRRRRPISLDTINRDSVRGDTLGRRDTLVRRDTLRSPI